MSLRDSGKGAATLLYLILFLLYVPASVAQQTKCAEDAKHYEDQQYQVRKVRIDTPLSWLFSSVQQALDGILLAPEMPIKAKDPFQKQPYDDGFLFIKERFDQLQTNTSARMTVGLAFPSLANCDDKTKQLDVVYRVYSISLSGSLTRQFEVGRKDEFARGVIETKSTRSLARFFVQPFVNYNRSRSVFGGTKFTATIPNAALKTISIDASGSSSSSEVRATVGGSRERERGVFRREEWAADYFRSDVPSNDVALARGTGGGYFAATTRPLGASELIMNLGGAVEGGNRQTDLAAVAVLPGDVARSGYKSIKGFVGLSMSLGRHAFKASYGAQFGNAGDGFKLDYIKHVFDSGADMRFTPWDPHYPIAITARFTAGMINVRGQLPVAERFIGGNNEQNFIDGASWVIQDNPLIRSFPQNRFSRTDAANFIGGDRFFSTNLTVAATVWARPLVPKEIVDYCARPKPDAEGNEDALADAADDNCLTLDEVVDFELSGAESIIKGQYVSETPEFQAMADNVKGLVEPLTKLKGELKLANQIPNPEVQAILKQIFQPAPSPDLEPSGSYALVAKSVIKVVTDLKEDKANRADIRTLAVGRQGKPGSSRIEKMNAHLASLTAHLPADLGGRINALRAIFEQTGALIKTKFIALELSDIDRTAAEKARKDMIYPNRIVKALIHETNLYSLSPVGFFDAARLRQNEDRLGDPRYAAGGGLRFTFVGLELTGGYTWTLHRRPWESRGALVFSMELSNLFR